jgi:peptidoglycan/LPS O-acetylase OafA/YrhL
MPQLDGLRALAVTAVVLQHYNVLEGGAAYGVHLFFVLSGFLITGILLKARSAVEANRGTWKQALGQFYIRRALRIFPLYYLVVLVAVAVNAEYSREYSAWLLTYTINIKMAAQGWYIGNFAHFWSLAVEEQFYLAWPCLILLVPRRWLASTAVVMTAIGPLYRLWLAIAWLYLGSDASPLHTYIATPTALDSLGIGSLVAILSGDKRRMDRVALRVAIAATLVVVAAAVVTRSWWTMTDTATAIVFGWVVHRAASGFAGLPGKILAAPQLVFIGRISYGIYVFHPLVPTVVAVTAAAIGFALPAGTGGVVLSVALTLLVATVSWFAIERPINNLKQRFEPAG